MSAPDAEDGLDQLLGGVQGQVAQKLSILHSTFEQRSRELHAHYERRDEERRRMEAADQREREARARRLEAQRDALHDWESANRARLNEGFEYIIDQSILTGDVSRLSDRHLARAWVVADQLDGHDPGYAAKLARARTIMSDEWRARHPDTRLEAVADQSVNHAVITYAKRDADLERTVDAFRKAGIPTDLVAARDPEGFLAAHPSGFRVETRMNGGWDGWDEQRIQDAVLQDAHAGIDDPAIDQSLAWLKDADLDEAMPADTLAGGIEPATVSESERSENRDAAPIQTNTDNTIQATALSIGQNATDPMTADGTAGEPRTPPPMPDPDAPYDMDTLELGGDDVFGAWDVAAESELAADAMDAGTPIGEAMEATRTTGRHAAPSRAA